MAIRTYQRPLAGELGLAINPDCANDTCKMPDTSAPLPANEIYAEQTVYGQVGPLQVVRLIRSDLNLALTHIVVLGHPRLGPTFIAGFPDTEEGVGLADQVGQAVVHALQIAGTPFS